MTAKNKVIKRPNRQVTRRLEGLTSKLLAYGELDGIELAFIAYNTKKNDIYSYLSSSNISWLGRIEKMVSLFVTSSRATLSLSAIAAQG